MIENLLTVAVGGAIGSVLRASLIRWIANRATRSQFAHARRIEPIIATLAPNTLGCLLLGVFLFVSARSAENAEVAWPGLFIATGICGGLTTFSTLCADGVRLNEARSRRVALAYLVVSLAAGVIAFNFLTPLVP